MPLRASSAVVVLAAMASWTRMLRRRSGRAKTTAMMTRAGARARMSSSSVGLSTSRMAMAPTRLRSDESSEVIVCVSRVRTWVTSIESREMSSPTRRRT